MPYNFKSILFSILITLVAYGAFPLIFAKIRKKAITTRTYYFICFAFNFFIRLLFFIFNNNPSASAPYVIWTIAFSALGKHILNDKYILVANRKQICPNCKAPLRPNKNHLLWCSSCGYVSQPIKQTNVINVATHIEHTGHYNVTTEWKCSCGRVHPKNVFSCVCGKSKTDCLNKNNLALDVSETIVASSEDSHPAVNKFRFCYNCGTKLVANSRFCSNCGTKITSD